MKRKYSETYEKTESSRDSAMEDPSQSNQPQLCGNGCGYFGSPQTDGMCSKCFKDVVQKKNNTGRKSPAVKSTPPPVKTEKLKDIPSPSDKLTSAIETTNTSDLPGSSKIESDSPSSSNTNSVAESPSKPKKSRCSTCRKRVGLTGFTCRCGEIFCGLHRYSDQHSCDFDYKADGQAKIRKENPVIVGEKINKI